MSCTNKAHPLTLTLLDIASSCAYPWRVGTSCTFFAIHTLFFSMGSEWAVHSPEVLMKIEYRWLVK